MNGWIVVVRIKLLTGQGYTESSPFAVAAQDQESAIEIIRRAFPLKHDVEITTVEALSAQEVAVLGLKEGKFQVRRKRVARHSAAGQALAEGESK